MISIGYCVLCCEYVRGIIFIDVSLNIWGVIICFFIIYRIFFIRMSLFVLKSIFGIKRYDESLWLDI